MTSTPLSAARCPVCEIGHLHTTYRTHVRVYGGTLVHLPNIPTHRCDICGEVIVDENALRRCEVLIGQSGPPPNRPPGPVDVANPSNPDDGGDSRPHRAPK